MHYVVDRWKDFMERVGWTALEAAGGAGFDVLMSGHVTWRAAAYAVAIAAGKVIFAQRVGKTNDGAAIPGGVIEPKA